MILLDYSQVVISTITADIGSRNNQHLDADLLRHMVLNTIRSYNQKYRSTYGEMVIACDSRNYWRKDIFPYYKANRKKNRESSGIDWDTIFKVMGSVREELHSIFPYKTIHIDRVEADDIIAVLAEWAIKNDTKAVLFDERPNPVLIVSGDSDFIQLQKWKEVNQYSPILRKMLTEKNPERFLLDHILHGDTGDGVPNVLSKDNCLAEGIRQKPMMKKYVDQWLKDESTMPTTDEFKRNFARNKTLIDLGMIPMEIKNTILEEFLNQPKKDRSKLINYFIANKMKGLLDVVSDF